jgi:hypothetical protein
LPAHTASSGSREPGVVAELSAWDTLDALDTGVLLLSPELNVLYANTAWATWLGAPVAQGIALRLLLEDGATSPIDELHATLADGEPRTMQLVLQPARADAYARRVSGVARRLPTGGLVLEARTDVEDDREALHDIARRLAEVTDMAEVLRTLCEIAARQCHGTGAAVLRMTGNLGEVVAASGDLIPARGRCFELTGSMMGEALALGELISEENFKGSGRPSACSRWGGPSVHAASATGRWSDSGCCRIMRRSPCTSRCCSSRRRARTGPRGVSWRR